VARSEIDDLKTIGGTGIGQGNEAIAAPHLVLGGFLGILQLGLNLGAIGGIEVIDLATDAGANTVTLTAFDVVLDISDTDIVTITGDAGDSVEAGTGWTDGGISGGFHTYTQGLATLLVDTDVSVNADITA